MCIYIHPCLSLPKQREVTGVVHIGVGFLRCSFLMIWHCEGLEHGTDEGEIPTPLLYILAGITIIRSSNGNPGDAHLQNDMIHAGQLIERTLHEQGRTVTWFATQLCCTRPNVYKIFEKRISTSTCSGASPASSAMIFSAIFPTASIPETSPVYPNRIQFRIVLGTMLSPGSILLSHTFAGILTYNHKRT